MKILLFVLVVMAFITVGVKGRYGTFSVSWDWRGLMPNIRITTGRDYSSAWASRGGKDALYQSMTNDYQAELKLIDISDASVKGKGKGK